MQVAVVGGSGTIGRHVTRELEARGHRARVLARAHGVDVTRRAGLEEALRGCSVVVDAVNVLTLQRSVAVDFFATAARNLLDAGAAVGVEHHVLLSIVGIDRVEGYGYYAGKLRQERLVNDSTVPSTILRTTQFHEFPGQILDRVWGPVAVVPRMRIRPLAARQAATALVDLALGPPRGRVPDLAGPEVRWLPELCRRWLAARRSARGVVGLPLPGAVGRALAGGALLPEAPHDQVDLTFDRWLEAS